MNAYWKKEDSCELWCLRSVARYTSIHKKSCRNCQCSDSGQRKVKCASSDSWIWMDETLGKVWYRRGRDKLFREARMMILWCYWCFWDIFSSCAINQHDRAFWRGLGCCHTEAAFDAPLPLALSCKNAVEPAFSCQNILLKAVEMIWHWKLWSCHHAMQDTVEQWHDNPRYWVTIEILLAWIFQTSWCGCPVLSLGLSSSYNIENMYTYIDIYIYIYIHRYTYIDIHMYIYTIYMQTHNMYMPNSWDWCWTRCCASDAIKAICSWSPGDSYSSFFGEQAKEFVTWSQCWKLCVTLQVRRMSASMCYSNRW